MEKRCKISHFISRSVGCMFVFWSCEILHGFFYAHKLSTCDIFDTYSLDPVSHLEINIKEFYWLLVWKCKYIEKSPNFFFNQVFQEFYLWSSLFKNLHYWPLCFIMPITYWGYILTNCIGFLKSLIFRKILLQIEFLL